MELSVKEAKLTGFVSKELCYSSKGLILKFVFWSENWTGLSRNWPQEKKKVLERFLYDLEGKTREQNRNNF